MTAPVEDDITPIAELSPAGDDDGLGRPARVLGVVVAALLAVGLGVVTLQLVGGDDRTPQERLTAAPAAAEASKTFAFQVTAETAFGTMRTSVQLDGLVDATARRSTATMDLLGRKLELVTDGTAAYVKVPAEERGLNQGKGWIKVPVADVGGGAAQTSPTASPLDTFRQLTAAGSDVQEVGKEDVRGTETTHYRTRLDLSKQPGVGPLADRLTNVPVDVWLDDQDRPRRYQFVMTVPVPGQAPGTQTTLTTTIEAFDYGKPVTIEVPDPADVADSGAAGLGAILGGSAVPAPS